VPGSILRIVDIVAAADIVVYCRCSARVHVSLLEQRSCEYAWCAANLSYSEDESGRSTIKVTRVILGRMLPIL
jgi:hypothetical protein